MRLQILGICLVVTLEQGGVVTVQHLLLDFAISCDSLSQGRFVQQTGNIEQYSNPGPQGMLKKGCVDMNNDSHI